ncbi:GumC family protein [Sagittula stellata]|uniref:Chain length determinant protein, putative n=1 Tax=Sagittula stellata (strain ATCC 700073 / DSM 11524 / E-37) TaxID=388399 RepID=A3K8W6_SAGS3|nr:Wzz/FepE/Etk N-terminal domain-containing protein [Sagittula stellata]EBA06349.1 chain length determinant protein, putative [Sagittula stellata E-37]
MSQFQSVGEVFAALRRRAWVILGIFLVGCVISVDYALMQQKVYEATAVVQIEDARVTSTATGTAADANEASRRLQLIEQRLMSRDNLVSLMDKYDLFAEDPALNDGERIYMMRQAARITPITRPGPTFSAAAQAPSGLMISVMLPDPEKAAVVANDLMTKVIAESRDRSAEQASETLAFYQTEEARVDAEIVALEDRIADYKKANSAQLPAGVAALRTELTTLRETELDLSQEIITIQGDTARKRPEDLARQVAQLEDQRALVAARATEIEGQIASAPEVERQLGQLEREMDRLKDQYSVITRGKAEAEMGQALQDRQAAGRYEVLETALVPDDPVTSSRKKIAGMGAVASLIAGLIVALVFEIMNPAIRTQKQMERVLGIQPVVVIPVISTRRDRTWGGLKFLAKALGIVALVGGVAAWLTKISGLGALFGGGAPRRAVRG